MQNLSTHFFNRLTQQVCASLPNGRQNCKFSHQTAVRTASFRIKRPSELQVFASNGRRNCKFSHQTAYRTANFRIKWPSELQTAVRTASFRIKRPSELQVFASNGRQNCMFSHQTAVRTASFRIKRPSELFASTLVNRSKRLSVRKLRRFSSMSGRETKFADF